MSRESRRQARSARGGVRRLAACALAVALLGPVTTAPAHASPDTMRRAVSNIVGGPMDMLLSPITGILTLARNIQDIEDSTAVRVVYVVPGWVWLTGLNFGAGGIRFFTGTLETLPGFFLFPFETDIDTLFDPVDDAGALIDYDNPLMWVENPWFYYNPLTVPLAIYPKWGINYTRAEL